MSDVYVYVRKVGLGGTKVFRTSRLKALDIIESHLDSDYQIGILGGRDLSTITRVYGEFRPYHEVSTEAELLEGLN